MRLADRRGRESTGIKRVNAAVEALAGETPAANARGDSVRNRQSQMGKIPPIRTRSSPGWVPIVVTVALCAGIIIALWIAATRPMTTTESVLLGILLSAASILASWVATHLYSQINLKDAIANATETNTENTRNLAVRAAEKVLNLSSEIERLTEALSAALDDSSEIEGTKQVVVVLRERILAAIHNLETLKSMNDTFLSDWRGVIGEEIDRQQAVEAQIEALNEELQAQKRERSQLRGVSKDDLSAIQSRIDATEDRINQKIAELPFRVSTKQSKPKAIESLVSCPSCNEEVKVKIRHHGGARKLVQCESCSKYCRVAISDEGDSHVSPVPMFEFVETCPLCTADVAGEIPDHSGAMVSIVCGRCEVALLVSRSNAGVNTRIPRSSRKKVPDRIVELVRVLLPPRPWPQYIHKRIASDLNLSNSVVSLAIGRLLSDGFFPLPEGDVAGSAQTAVQPSESNDDASAGEATAE